jgi:uncharacterized cofD-like protein
VALGGGHGLAKALESLRRLDVEPTAIVTTADDGGSSGRLRRDLDIIAPGDLRMALLALARNADLAALLGHRFGSGELEGHALGNLVLVALAERAEDSFVAALEVAGELLDCVGRVLPTTTVPVQLRARVDGREVDGQVRVMTTRGRIERVWVEPDDAPACEESLHAIEEADVAVLGPGSLFTSVVASVALPEIAAALSRKDLRVIYIANITTQPGETTALDAGAHVDALLGHVPGLVLDAVLLHDGPVGDGPGAPLGTDLEHPGVRRVLRGDLLARDAQGRPAWGHDPARLSALLGDALGVPARVR